MLVLDGQGAAHFRRRHQGERQAALAGAAGATDAVGVGFRVVGRFQVDHQVQGGDVQAPGGHVRGHQHRQAVVGEQAQHLVPVALLQVPVQGPGGDALGVQVVRHLLALPLGGAEHHAGGGAQAVQQPRHRLQPVFPRHLVETLLDVRAVLFRGHFDGHRIAQETARQGLDRRRPGGGEQQCPPPRRVWPTIPAMLSTKPMSSIRSASSSTRVFRPSRDKVPLARCFSIRPGVPTMICAPCSRSPPGVPWPRRRTGSAP